MLPTHALKGMLLAVPVAWIAPEFAEIALFAGFLGGIVPDLDMYVGHRKTLHFPVWYSVLTVPALVIAAIVPTGATVAIAIGLLAAAVHSLSDVLGGGLELRPWEGTSDRAVYDHYRKRWIPPRRWIRYDGSPGDFSLSALFAAPLVLTVDGTLQAAVVATVTVAAVYAAVRRRLPDLAETVLSACAPLCPPHLLERVPARYLTEHHHRPRATASRQD